MIDSSIKAQIKTSLFQSVYSAIQKIFEYVKDHKYLPVFYTEISNHFEYLSKAETAITKMNYHKEFQH